MARFDVVVCGLGVIGSAALYELARRGVHVLGIDRFAAGHERGSSHGETRIIRLSYFEHPSYVPLLRRAYALWHAIEQAAGQKLLHVTGIVEIGSPESTLVAGTLASAHMHGIVHERLTATELAQRYPAFHLPPDFVGVLQPDGGFVEAEASVAALQSLARQNGAAIRTGEAVKAIEQTYSGVRIVTARETIEAGTAVIAAGPWVSSLLPAAALPLRITRQVMAWFAPTEPALFAPGRFPVFLMESRYGIHYGFPPLGSGIKVAKHHHADEAVDPNHYDRNISAADEAMIRAAIAEYVPAANGQLTKTQTCLYTVTPDGDFIIDQLSRSIVIASACSGHGFKFAPVVGEIIADLAVTGATAHDISRFRLGRFG